MSRAILVLTRGYDDINKYNVLLERNINIDRNLKDKTIPLLFFHEGNITDEHQTHIKNKQPNLIMKFINISDKCFLKEKENTTFYPRTDEPWWGYGYRHMCNFWFKDFYHYVKDYQYVLRIDEDCFIRFSIDRAFEHLLNNNSPFLYGHVFGDPGFVVVNLNNTTMNFLKENNFKNIKSRNQVGPYTNIFGMDLNKIREKWDILSKYHEYIDKSNGIYQYRWGDLPLWGEMMYYLFDIDCSKHVEKWLTYYHKSHGKTINA
tara:strand:- start:401 stop:1183 length:783 start_codon:yes stop_codon:yes gene_type:complete